MPLYSIQGPDGKTYSIEGPPGATREQVIQAIEMRLQERQPVAQPAPALLPEDSGFFRQALDIPVQVSRGVVGGIRMLADVFGAGSSASEALKGADTWLADLLSAEAKNDQQRIAQILKDAQDQGALGQIKAGLQAFLTAPADLISQALGSTGPVILAGLASGPVGTALGIGRLGAAAMPAVGAAMGVGEVKGSIYESVKDAYKQQGATEEEAEAKAQEAQSYGGANLPSLVAAGGLGALAGRFGIEAPLTSMLRGGARETAEQQALRAAERGLLARTGIGAFTESAPEFAQAGQSKLAENIALRNEGFDVPLFQGVFGAAAMEGAAGAVLGGGLAIPRSGVERLPGQRDGESDADFARRISREIDAARRREQITPLAQPISPAEVPAETPAEPIVSTEGVDLYRLPDGTTGTLEQAKAYAMSVPPQQRMQIIQQILANRIPKEAVTPPDLFTKPAEAPAEVAEKPAEVPAVKPPEEVKPAEAVKPTEEIKVEEIKPGQAVTKEEEEAAADAAKGKQEQNFLLEYPIFEIPIDQLTLSKDVPQFKGDADTKGLVEQLEGKFDQRGVAPIQVWKRNDGRLEVISGRHRFDLAQRSGEKLIRAQIHEEATGFDADQASILDAELNIRDQQGKGKDYVAYFKKSGLSEEEASARGLLGRAPGKPAFAIAKNGSEELVAAHRADIVSDPGAAAIANAAPGDARLQAVGIKAIQEGKSPLAAVNLIKAVQTISKDQPPSDGGDLFGFDDSAMREAEDMAKIATLKQNQLAQRLAAISGASRRPEIAKKEGIDIKDPEALKKREKELRQQKAAWDNWPSSPELVQEIRQEMRGEVKPAEEAAPKPTDIRMSLREAIKDTKESVESQLADWKSRSYKRFDKTIELSGEGPRKRETMTVTEINENRREKAIKNLTQELNAVRKLEQQIETDRGLDDFVDRARSLYQRAKDSVEAKTSMFKTPGDAFEYALLNEELKIFPPGKGSYTSNSISKAVRRVIEQYPEEVKTEVVETKGEAVSDEDLLGLFSTALGQKPSLAAPAAAKPAPSPELQAKIDLLGKALTRIMSRYGLKDVALKLVADMKAEGEYSSGVLSLALDAADPVSALRHESIHAMKELGFFSDQQWKSLERQAKEKWINQYLKQKNVNRQPLQEGQTSRYDAYMNLYGGDEEAVIEEAIADAFADFDATKAPPGMLQALLRKIQNFFQAIKEAFGAEPDAERIFRKAERGALKPFAVPQVNGQSERLSLSLPEDYRGEHRPPTKDSGSPAHDLSGAYPDDVYSTNGPRYYAHYADSRDLESFEIIRRIRNKPNVPLTIYRAVPKSAPSVINNGDWVTISKRYAKEHGEGPLRGDYKLISKLAHPRDIFTNGDSIHEWGYDPQPMVAREEAEKQGFKYSLREVPLSTRGLMEVQPIVAMQELGLKTESTPKPGGIELFNDVRSIAQALNRDTVVNQGVIGEKDVSTTSVRKIAKAVADEIAYQVKSTSKTGTGLGWYSNNYPNAVRKLAKEFPELETSEYARTVFSALVAITSNGEKVAINVKNAKKLYEQVRVGKEMVAPGTRRDDALENNIAMLRMLMAKHGKDLRAELMREITVKDMNAALRQIGQEPDQSYLANATVPASAIYFGPKLGAFFSNLEGAEGYLTMDLWWTRTINRMRGLLIPKATPNSIKNFRLMMDQPNATRDEVVAATIPLKQKYEQQNFVTELEFLVSEKYRKAIEREFRGDDKKIEKELKKVSKEPSSQSPKFAKWHATAKKMAGAAYQQLLFEHKLEKLANSIHKNEYEMLEEAPFTASDRQFMYRIAREAQRLLQREDINLSIADIQAALWYYEKRLYQHLSGRKADDIGYDEAITQLARDSTGPAEPSVVFGGEPAGGAKPAGAGTEAGGVRGEPTEQPKLSLRTNIFDEDVLASAIEESKKLDGLLGNAIENDAQGVIPGKQRLFDRGLDRGYFTEDQVREAFKNTLSLIREKHGDELTLWRSDAPDAEKSGDTRTVFMADKDVAEKYAANGREAKPYQVKTDDVLAVYALPSGYYEAIVKKPDSRFSLRAPQTEAFKRWFGDSKVVDENGEPLVVYHGTRTGDITAFDPTKQDPRDAGFWFGTSQAANQYAASSRGGGNVMPVYLRIVNPKVYTNRDVKITPNLIKELEAEGYDGVLRDFAAGEDAWRYPPGEREWAVFRPEQIKSATGNIGTFDPTKPDIRYSLRNAAWTDNRVKSLLDQYSYISKGREKDTKAYAAYIRPEDFLNATATKEYRKQLESEKEPLDAEKLASESQEIYLEIKEEEDGVYQIVGHEGRHRMMALQDAGVSAVPVTLVMRPYGAVKNAEVVEEPYFKPQVFEGKKSVKGFSAMEMIPISWDQRENLKDTFGGEGKVKFSLREAPRLNLRDATDPATRARIDQTTTPRDEKTFIQRITEAIAPKSASHFRAAFLNRYDRLADYDKELVRQMGGAPLLADSSAEAAALMSDLSAGVMASAMGVYDRVGGIPVYVNGHTKVVNNNNTVKGPIAIFAPLAKYNDPFIYQKYQFWAAVNRGLRLYGQGRDTELITPTDQAEADKILIDHPEFTDIQKEWITFNNGLVKYLLDTGVLTEKSAQEFVKYADYIPFYRQVEGEETVGPQIFASLSGVKAPKKLKGSQAPLGEFLETVVRNVQYSIEAGMKNSAAQKAVNIAQAIGQADRLNYVSSAPNVIKILERGKPTYYASQDPLFVDAMKSLNLGDLPFIGLLAGPANLLRSLVTKDPAFMLANMMRDSMSAWVTSGVKMTPIVDTLTNFGKALGKQNPEYAALLNSGVIGGYDYSQGIEVSADRFNRELRKEANVYTTKEKIAKPFVSLWDALEKGTMASDAATRMEVYKKTLAETNNEAEAFFRSLEVMNFNRKGNNPMVRVLTAAVPFLNARMQGLDVLYRAAFAKGSNIDSKEIQKRFFVRGMTIAALSTMYWMLASEDDEWKKQEQETRDNYWIIPSLGVKIPIPFEIGVLFKVIPERILEYSFGDDTGKDFLKSMARQLTGTLAFNPIPQTLLPAIESVTNFSFFTMRPIVSQGLEDVSPAYQVGPTTSRLGELIGGATRDLPTALQISPTKVDALIRGYTGTLGGYMVDLFDAIYDMNSDAPKAAKRFEQMPVIRRFAVDPQARGQVTAYYELKNAVDEAVRTSNLLERNMQPQQWGEYFEENKGLFAIKDYILDLEKSMKQYREMKNFVRASSMDADQKREIILNITTLENQLVSNIQEIKKMSSGQ